MFVSGFYGFQSRPNKTDQIWAYTAIYGSIWVGQKNRTRRETVFFQHFIEKKTVGICWKKPRIWPKTRVWKKNIKTHIWHQFDWFWISLEAIGGTAFLPRQKFKRAFHTLSRRVCYIWRTAMEVQNIYGKHVSWKACQPLWVITWAMIQWSLPLFRSHFDPLTFLNMAKPLLSRVWSSGSLDVGQRHLINVKKEHLNKREEMENELKA